MDNIKTIWWIEKFFLWSSTDGARANTIGQMQYSHREQCLSLRRMPLSLLARPWSHCLLSTWGWRRQYGFRPHNCRHRVPWKKVHRRNPSHRQGLSRKWECYGNPCELQCLRPLSRRKSCRLPLRPRPRTCTAGHIMQGLHASPCHWPRVLQARPRYGPPGFGCLHKNVIFLSLHNHEYKTFTGHLDSSLNMREYFLFLLFTASALSWVRAAPFCSCHNVFV